MESREQEAQAVKAVEIDQPIINSPFKEPESHWKVKPYTTPEKMDGRRPASYFYRVPRSSGVAVRQDGPSLFDDDLAKSDERPLEIVNAIRERVKEWREGDVSKGHLPYRGVTDITRRLLEHWNSDDRRQRLFFCQIEAAETIIYLVEVASKNLDEIPDIPLDEPGPNARAEGIQAFVRYACKMATGSGKTTVMSMLSAWSILNSRAAPRDRRFSDTVLVICPGVTIASRLREIDPGLGKQSLYYTRKLVPQEMLSHLSHGKVSIMNWHRLEKKKTSTASSVVKTGEKILVMRKKGKKDAKIEKMWQESDDAWLKRLFGNKRGRSKSWLVFNDEAHHAYRRGDRHVKVKEGTIIDEDDSSFKDRESTIWIEGLDRINRLIGDSSTGGIGLCIDLSATPFYLEQTGNDVGTPFPWIVSDFGLLDSIESGLVKIPQLPTRDQKGDEIAGYFNIWRWIQEKAERDKLGKILTPEIILNYATHPINMLAVDWKKRFDEWKKYKEWNAVPPVFIVVCSTTAVAKRIHGWLSGEEKTVSVPAPRLFRNEPNKEVTIRVDTEAFDNISKISDTDDVQRLRYILDTIGKSEWAGGAPPSDLVKFVERHNSRIRRAISKGQKVSARMLDSTIPPGRDIRCIVSVSMLTEGWDANNVTHIIGLRPFGSQLLCEQVVGRALRRKSYNLDEETGLFLEETATVFGVPFELVPFKRNDIKPHKSARDMTHIKALKEKSKFMINIPMVTRYLPVSNIGLHIEWDQIPVQSYDESAWTEVKQVTAQDGRDTVHGAGKTEILENRGNHRLQEAAFRLAKGVCSRWREENDAELAAKKENSNDFLTLLTTRALFQKILPIAIRFVKEKIEAKRGNTPQDILHMEIKMKQAVDALYRAIRSGDQLCDSHSEVALIPLGSENVISTENVDYHSAKIPHAAEKCHLNALVCDSDWERDAAREMDAHPGVRRWVKNDKAGLSFNIPYWNKHDIRSNYQPDFIVVTDRDVKIIIEIKGWVDDPARIKEKAGERWAKAVSCNGEYGQWEYRMITSMNTNDLIENINEFCDAKKGLFEIAT